MPTTFWDLPRALRKAVYRRSRFLAAREIIERHYSQERQIPVLNDWYSPVVQADVCFRVTPGKMIRVEENISSSEVNESRRFRCCHYDYSTVFVIWKVDENRCDSGPVTIDVMWGARYVVHDLEADEPVGVVKSPAFCLGIMFYRESMERTIGYASRKPLPAQVYPLLKRPPVLCPLC